MPQRMNGQHHKQATITAISSWLELEASIKMVEAHTLKGELEEAEDERERASALLLIHMDAKQAGIALVRHVAGMTNGKSK